MGFVVGIDQSVNHTAVCILNDDATVNYLGLIEPGKRKDQERLAYVRDQLTTLLAPQRYLVGVLEGYSYGSVNKKFLLGEIGAVVKLCLHDHCDVVHCLAPTQLKKFVTGRGGASKEDVMFAIEKQWSIMLNDDNLADAYGLARAAYLIAKPQTVKRHQLDVLNAVLKPKEKTRKTRMRNAYKNAL
jgi:crossover junction endodeoxyribonuclease RuvC